MTYSEFHWKVFNFLARKVVAPGFIVVGMVGALYGIPNLLPGGTILVNGVPSDDLVLRWISVVLPFIFSIFGLAMFKAKPFVPPKK